MDLTGINWGYVAVGVVPLVYLALQYGPALAVLRDDARENDRERDEPEPDEVFEDDDPAPRRRRRRSTNRTRKRRGGR